MRRFREHRQKITKNYCVRGEEKKKSGTDKITSHTLGVIKEMSIQGSTFQSELPSVDSPVPIKSMNGDGVNVTVSGINLYGAVSKPDIDWSGVTISCKDNVFTLDGKTTSKGTVRGVWFTMNNLKPDTVYSVRLTKISGSFIDSEIRFYGFRTVPNVAWRKTHFLFSDASLNECVKSFSYSEEEIAQGVGLGLYSCDLSENAEFTDYKVRVDIVEGSYTADTFPKYEPYIEPKTVTISTELNGIDGYNDVLTLDYPQNTVTVTRRVKRVKLADLVSENASISEYDGQYSIALGNVISWKEGTNAYCSHCKPYSTVDVSLGYETCFELLFENDTYNTYFYWIEQSTVEDFISWAKENDVEMVYVLNTEEVETVDVDLPKEILDYGVTSVIEVEGSNGIDMTYYDSEE